MPAYPHRQAQSGAVLLIMLVIMVLGIAAVLVSSLNSSGIKNARQNTSMAALMQAKETLIGRAASDPNRPGSLPCPDALTNNPGTNIPGDGIADLLVGNACPSYIGRLPWKTLGVTDLRDGSGAPLWYALSANFRDDNSNPINSETLGTLTISGNQTVNNIAAIIFAPGAPLCTQSRVANAALNQYLEAMPNVTATNAAISNTSNDCANTPYNDQHLAITAAQLIHSVEMRIGREVKACLDSYAASPTNGTKYPWAAEPTDISFPYSKSNRLFGRPPKHLMPDGRVRDMINSINQFQTAVTNCANNTGNQATLVSLGATLKSDANDVKNNQPTTPVIPTSVTSPAANAGDKAKDADVTCSDIRSNPTGNEIQTNLNSAISALDSLNSTFPWPASCTLFSPANGYWSSWKNQVFYQVDDNYRPGGALGTPSITINGVGSYRAIVVVARSPISGQVRNPLTAPTGYLDLGNAHTSSTPNIDFIANRPTEAGFSAINDLVICLDGQQTCK